MTEPHVALVPPAGWRVADDIEPPPLVGEAQLASFAVWASEKDAVVAGCVKSAIPGWVEEMRPAVAARAVALAGAAAERAAGTPVDAQRAEIEGAYLLRPAGDLGARPLGVARMFLGFDPDHLYACFAVCTRRSSSNADPGCREAVLASSLAADGPPPPPSAVLRAATWGVHHPRESALGGGLLALLLGVLAVTTRRKPRSRL